MTNVLSELWNLAETILKSISKVWDWLFDVLIIKIPIKIPLLIPDGLEWNTGVTPISLLGVGMIAMIIYWFIWGR